MSYKWINIIVGNFGLLICTSTLSAAIIDVNCDTAPPGALSSAVSAAAAGTTINVKGTCHDAIIINKDDISLIGNLSETAATITGFFPQDRITIDGATRVQISGFNIENGIIGIVGTANSSFTISNSEISNNILGMDVNNGSNAFIEGDVKFFNHQAFGLQVLNNSSLRIQADAVCTISNNTLGAQISVNSSVFVADNAHIIVTDNRTIGFSVNTGSTGMLFNAKLTTTKNGLDGLDIVSAANFEVDGDSEVLSEHNGRDGISIDDGTLNMFGFFSTQAGFPRITSLHNGRHGVFVEATSKLDVGRNSSIISKYNGAAGVNLDDGSSALIQRGVIQNNNGKLTREDSDDDDHHQRHHHPADVILTFGSRISFRQSADSEGKVTENQVGLALCDKSSLSRGDVKCKKP